MPDQQAFGNSTASSSSDLMIREAEIDVAARRSVAVAHARPSRAPRRIESGEKEYHFVEIMACPGGCIAGGGQPFSQDPDIKSKRASVLYAGDRAKKQRMSHDNPAVKKLYGEFLETPGSEIAHKLLHTTYCQGEKCSEKASANIKEAS